MFLWFKAGERLPVGRYDARVLQQNVQEGEMSHATRKMPENVRKSCGERSVFVGLKNSLGRSLIRACKRTDES